MASATMGADREWFYFERAMVGRPTTRNAPPFGKRLALFRERKALTQAQLADQLAVSQQLVAYYERRATNPSLAFIEKAAAALGVTVADLVGSAPGETPAATAPKRGPKSQLDERVERVKRLPKAKQALIVRMIDVVLAEHVGR